MNRYDKRVQALAVGLSALAGFVDAVGFIKLGGFFVSFMSGNSTRFAVGLAEGSTQAAVAAGLIVTFVFGVILGSLTGRLVGRSRRPTVLILVAALLASATILHLLGLDHCAVAAMVMAMGVENTTFEENGEARIGLTYMTGTLVKIGQGLSEMIVGGHRTAWLSYLFLWLGLVVGAVAGASSYPCFGFNTLSIAAFAALGLALISLRLDRGRA